MRERNIFEKFLWAVKSIFYKIKGTFRKIKWFIQRGKHGYAECDLWNFDHYLAKLFKNSLNDFADMTTGWPEPYESYEDWIKTLKDVALLPDCFEADDMIDWDREPTSADFEKASENAEIAIHLFFDWMKENFTKLWD